MAHLGEPHAAPDPVTGDLPAIERHFQAMRRAPPDLMGACATALDPAWHSPARAIAAALDGAPQELPYHNRHHFAEATRAMGWLCDVACAQGAITPAERTLGVIAMLGHDIDHDGSARLDGRLEAASAARIIAITAAAGVAAADCARIGDIILATNPTLIARNAAGGNPLFRLANEADVFASLLPHLGRELGDALAVERGLPPGSHRERLAFLRIYDGFSAAAVALGLAQMQAHQIAAFALAGEDGAAKLDAMDRATGLALYDQLLDSCGSGKG